MVLITMRMPVRQQLAAVPATLPVTMTKDACERTAPSGDLDAYCLVVSRW